MELADEVGAADDDRVLAGRDCRQNRATASGSRAACSSPGPAKPICSLPHAFGREAVHILSRRDPLIESCSGRPASATAQLHRDAVNFRIGVEPARTSPSTSSSLAVSGNSCFFEYIPTSTEMLLRLVGDIDLAGRIVPEITTASPGVIPCSRLSRAPRARRCGSRRPFSVGLPVDDRGGHWAPLGPPISQGGANLNPCFLHGRIAHRPYHPDRAGCIAVDAERSRGGRITVPSAARISPALRQPRPRHDGADGFEQCAGRCRSSRPFGR